LRSRCTLALINVASRRAFRYCGKLVNSEPTPLATAALAYPLVSSIARGDDLARLVRDCLIEAAVGRTDVIASIVSKQAAEAGIAEQDAQSPWGNVIEALKDPSAAPQASGVLGALLARSLVLDPPEGIGAEDAVASRLVWLAANLNVDAFGALDVALGDKAPGLWGAVADLIQRYEAGTSGLSLPEAIVAAAALGASQSATARSRSAALSLSARNPLIKRLVRSNEIEAGSESPPPVTGELAPAPRGPVGTFLLAICGWLVVAHTARLIGRLALQYRRPAELTVIARSVRVRSRTKLLGKVLRETETVIPIESLARATREVRFPRASVYTGLIALALGSYMGMSWFIDGLRASSLSLVGIGLLVMAAGIGLDFLLTSILPGTKGRCRVLLVPRRGAPTCVAAVDIKVADDTLAQIAKR
jgi:hypothetical protein